MVRVDDAAQVDLQAFDPIVIGASIRYGKHSKQVTEFIRRNTPLLDSKPNAFFSVNIVARKPDKNQPDTNPYPFVTGSGLAFCGQVARPVSAWSRV